jgi:putative OPT family oligopeptide transporter
MAQSEPDTDDSAPQYTPAPGEAQLTARAIIAGCITGSIVACTNIYIGLQIGWSFGGSIIAAVLSYAAFLAIGKRLTVLETNIAQTAGAAAGGMTSAAGLLNVIPAMTLLGHQLAWSTLMLWALAVSFLGVFFAVPLRRQFIEVDKLRFPTGTATAATILAMNSEAGEAIAKARVLVWATAIAGAFTLLTFFIPQVKKPPLHEWIPIAPLVAAASWGFTIDLGPSLFGAGFLMGPRVVLSLLFGAVLSWGILGPIAQSQGWAPGQAMDFANAPRGWILWPGVALMVSEALTSLALSWRTFARALRLPTSKSKSAEIDPERIPDSWWIGGLVAGSVVTVVISSMAFEIHWYFTLLAIALSSVLAAVATRSQGETDINPIGGMGKVTQLVFGALSPGHIVTNLMTAGITSGGAAQAADMMQDLKTGYLLGASPRKQFGAQLFGICAGLVVAVPVYAVFTWAHPLGSEENPAPAGFAWKAVAELLVEGFGALPPHAPAAMAIAAAAGIMFPALRQIKAIKPFVPSGLAIGIAFITYAFNSLSMFFGLVVWLIWKWRWPSAAEKYTFAVASGMIAGEGLLGIVNAGLTIAGVKPRT